VGAASAGVAVPAGRPRSAVGRCTARRGGLERLAAAQAREADRDAGAIAADEIGLHAERQHAAAGVGREQPRLDRLQQRVRVGRRAALQLGLDHAPFRCRS
jgi:hypothetical protein